LDEPSAIQHSSETTRGGVITGRGGVNDLGSGVQILPPVTALIELTVIVGLLLLVDAIWPALDINNLQPSPYWIPVLLLSLQYGTPSGSLAAILAIAVYFAFVTLPEQGVGENEFTYRLHILAQPILWIAAAVLLGQFRMVQIATKQALTHRLTELEYDGNVLADYATQLRSRCDELERAIAGRALSDGSSMLDALAGVTLAGPTARKAIENCLATAFPLASLSVFLKRGDGFERAISSGWVDDAPWLNWLPPDHALTVAILANRQRLTVLDPDNEAALAQQGVAAVPIISPAGDRVVGLVKIEQAEARYMAHTLPDALDVIARALAPWATERVGVVGPQAERFNKMESIVAPNMRAMGGALNSREEPTGHAQPHTTGIPVELIRPKALG
jgi:hypothetical protein